MNRYVSEFKQWQLTRSNTDRLQKEYIGACNTPSDINEHLPVLKSLAEEVSHVTEFGVRHGASTRAFLNTNCVLRSYDILHSAEVQTLFDIALSKNKDVQYIIADVTKIDIVPTDLLFIDTLHNYSQLSIELAMHADRVNKYIAFHDTHTYGTRDENSSDNIGLLPAIIEFLIKNPEWKFKEHRVNNNGLTIIERI